MFRVEWLQSALDDLANAWLKADSSGRRQITFAASQIEAALRNDPEDQGESRTEGRRIVFVEPLAGVFRVDSVNRLVAISGVWRFARRRREA
ncbi:MAG: hypothetical protein ACREHD_03205 [Pirellulales bacterium]